MRAVFDYLAPILDPSMVTQLMALLSLEVQRETKSRSSQEGRLSCYCTILSPRSLKHPRFITKTIYKNHIIKMNQE